MIKGVDISHHNKNMKSYDDIISNYDFIIMKASEGKGFKDSQIHNYMSEFRNPFNTKWPLVGFYHFARPEVGNSPAEEAHNFLNVITPYVGSKFIVALDVEDRALSVPFLDDWCLMWCKHVYDVLGFKPLIYCSASETKRFKKCASWGCGLWVAKWGNKPTKSDIKPWDIWAIWQYTNCGICSAVRVDENYFNGTKQQFLKYCEVISDEEEKNDTTTFAATD